MASSPSTSRKSGPRIAVIGAGVIGLSAALELRARGAEVTVYESGTALGAGATQRAAGMLGAAFEWALEAEQPALVALAMRSSELWPAFAAHVEKKGAGDIDFSTAGSIVLADTADEADWLERLAAACQAREIPAQRLSRAELARIEPAASPLARAALLLPGDQHVDPALLLQRLGVAAQRLGVGLRLGRTVERIAVEMRGSQLDFMMPDGFHADRVVLAMGLGWPAPVFSGAGENWGGAGAVIVPVQGHMLALAPSPAAPVHVLRNRDGYVAPKTRWTLVGSTMARGVDDTRVDRSVIDRLRRVAETLAPGLATAEEVSAWAGVRPGTPDDAPMIGECAMPGVFAALGFYRNGVLLAPAAVEMLADIVIDGKVSAQAAAFDPRRFDNLRPA